LRLADFRGMANDEASILSDQHDIIAEGKVVDPISSLGRQF
jgi:hypothetical protein